MLLQYNNVTIGTTDVYSPLVNPPVNAEYVSQLAISDAFVQNSQNKSILTKEGLQRTAWRAVNDVRTIEAYGRCMNAVSAPISKHYGEETMVIVVGDDAVLKAEVDITELLVKLRQKDDVILDLATPPGDTVTIKFNSSLLLPLQSHTSHFRTNYFIKRVFLTVQHQRWDLV